MKNKKGFMVFGAVATFIVMALGIGLFSLYQNYTQLQKQVYFNSANQGSENPNIQKDLAQLQKDVKNITDRQDKDAKYENDYSLNNGIIGRTLKEMAEKYFIESNSVVVNGAFRVGLRDSRIFSFDFPASVYKQFNEVNYDIAHKDSQIISFTQTSNYERIFVEVDQSFSSQTNFSVTCGESYDKDIQLAASVFKNTLETHEIDPTVYPNLDTIDFCKYVTKHKQVKSTYWNFLEAAPTLLAPKEDRSNQNMFFAYTFDTNKFFDETNSNDTVESYRKRYVLILRKESFESTYIDYHLFQVWFKLPFANHEGRNLREDKIQYARVEGILDTITQSLIDKTVVLPLCEYGCGY
ncbi:MAG: hypothetical protein KBD46_03425 [Candidatus Levybacteria bacterium]|nr:hypothetical protein [Candidatus Levybacteria bacterium]